MRTLMWKEAVNNLYQNYDLIQGNKSNYKTSVIRYGNVLRDENFIANYIKELERSISSSARTHTQTGIDMFKSITSEELESSYLRVKKDFEGIDDYSSVESLLRHYDRVKKEAFFNIFNKHKLAGELNSFFNVRLRNVVEHNEMKLSKAINFFTMRSGRNNKHYNDFINNKAVAITWGGLKDIRDMSYDQLVQYGKDQYDSSRSGSMFQAFRDAMSIGDILLLIKAGSKEVDLCVITSEMLYDETLPTYYATYRTFEILKTNVEFDFTYNIQSTITQIFNEQRLEALNNELDDETMTKYQDIMNNINTSREFKFEYIDTNETVEEDSVEFNNNHKQLIIDGAPGTGKSFGVNKEVKENNINHERVTFYSDYEYHNFVGSILPRLNGDKVTYEFVKGPFTKLLNDALSGPEDKHYLIIEELTRGNAAAIFGDIFQLLDRDEDGWSEYPITHDNILEALDPEVKVFLESEYGGKVVLPPNLSVICTINSSDQNVYPLDTAFKRRFDYKIESTEAHDEFVDYEIKFGTDINIDWKEFYLQLNKYILVDLQLKEDKQVGPYFVKNHQGDSAKLESIQTKLAMYLWNDLHKVHTISSKTIFKDVYTLYEVDHLFRKGTKQEILNILSDDFKQHFNLDDIESNDN